jgi:uncharacterized protein (TIGR00290 family)
MTAEPEDVIVCWSGGKDSCLALEAIRATHNVAALVTTLTRDFDRISMHGVRSVLLERQAEALDLSLHKVFIGKGASNDEYEAQMREAFLAFKARGITKIVFGDLFLEDIRAYRERMLAPLGMSGLYPIWGRDTKALIEDFVARGFKTAVVCVDPAKLAPSFAGRMIDRDFLSGLPRTVDPCGENGEFHTFVFDGPGFRAPVPITFGEIVMRDGFWFADLMLAD